MGRREGKGGERIEEGKGRKKRKEMLRSITYF